VTSDPLPLAWAQSTLREVAQITMGQSPPGSATNGISEGVPLLGGAGDLPASGGIRVSRYTTSPAKVCQPGDVLLCIRATIGRPVIADSVYCIGRGLAALRPHAVESEWLVYFLRHAESALNKMGGGSTFVSISGEELSTLSIPVPPLAEQRRIVAKLDALVASSRVARAALDAVPALIERYRQAVLGTAFRGLLDGSCATYLLQSLVSPGRIITYGIVQTGDPVPDGVPTVRCGDIKRFSVAVGALKRVAPSVEGQYPRTRLRGGEVLIAIRGSVGEVAIAPPALVGANVSREVAVIPAREDIEPEYLMYLLTSPVVASAISGHVKGVAQSGINLSDLRLIEVPLPSRERQRRIVAEIRDALARIDRLADRVTSTLADLDVLERATLAKAFRGELVSQNSADEPAATLLTRFRGGSAEPERIVRRRRAAARA
jgi:type I restriction enzyme, S subunit